MRYLKILLIISALGFFFVSCSEDDTPTGNNNNSGMYFDMAVGSYWINDNYNLNMQDDEIQESYEQDSTVVSEISTLDGKESYILEIYVDGSLDETTNVSEDEDAVYIRADYLLPDDLSIDFGSLALPEGWIKFYAKSMNTWNIVEEIQAEGANFEGIPLDVTLSITAEKDGTESINIDGMNVTADKMLMSTIIEASTDTPFGKIPIDLTVETYFYFAKGYGIVKSRTESLEKDLTIEKIEINGLESTTVRMEMK